MSIRIHNGWYASLDYIEIREYEVAMMHYMEKRRWFLHRLMKLRQIRNLTSRDEGAVKVFKQANEDRRKAWQAVLVWKPAVISGGVLFK